MKTLIKFILHRLLGFKNYLWLFARYKIKTLKNDSKESGFFAFMDKIMVSDYVVDLGANIGVMTYHLATRFPKSKVISFEPVAENLATLQKVIEHYNLTNVEVVNKAVGDENGKLIMTMPEYGGVREHGLAMVKNGTGVSGKDYEVPVVKLDDELNIKPGSRVGGIKIDIENYEYQALLGAQQIIANHKPIIYIELWDNENRTRSFELLNKLGYRPFVDKDGELIPYKAGEIESQYFIFAPSAD